MSDKGACPELSILEFIQDPRLLNDRSHSLAQRAALKTVYGDPLEGAELDIYRAATGRQDYCPREHSEASFICGRRSGKTSKLAAPIAIYEAFRSRQLPRGDRAFVVLIAPVMQQAEIAFRFIEAYIADSPVLKKWVQKKRKREVDLKNGVTIACYPCSYVTVRGVSVVAVIADEVGFWRSEETAANPAEEVFAALRPGMATHPKAKLIKISSPYAKMGTLWNDFNRRSELDFPVWQLPSELMNPTLDPVFLERERLRNEEQYRREYLAEFSDNFCGWIAEETLQACIIRGRIELPRVPKIPYVAAIDPGFRSSDFALAILHRTKEGVVVVDRVERWLGSSKIPISFESVCQQLRGILSQYGIVRVYGDQYCAAIIREQFGKLGIQYEEFAFSANTRAQIFGNLRHLILGRKIELLDHPVLLQQLRRLEEHRRDGGSIDIRPQGGKDDVAVALALGAFHSSQPTSHGSFIVAGRVARPFDNALRWAFQREDVSTGIPVAAICEKFPGCFDRNLCECLGLTPDTVIPWNPPDVEPPRKGVKFP